MNSEVLKKYTRWALIVFLGIMIVIGGITNDKPTQIRNTDEAPRKSDDAAKGRQVSGPTGSIGTGADAYRYEEELIRIGKDQRRTATGNTPTNPGRLQKYADNDGQQETRSYSLLLPWAGNWGSDSFYNRDNNIYDKVGIKFKTTAYTAGYESTGKRPGDKLYGITYSGKKVKEKHTVAADTDVLPIGTMIQIEGLPGTYVVEDTGSAVNGKHVDIYMEDLDDAQEYGVQYRRIVIVEERGAE